MDKDAYYFPHFCNARHDRKIKRVLKELSIEGYGIYFMLLEVLRDQLDFKYPLEDIDLLADEFGTSEAKIKTVINQYDLFEIDENKNFFSLKQIQYLQPYIRMKEQRKIAGLISGEKRRERMFNDRSTDVQRNADEIEQSKQESKEDERKGEETKEDGLNDLPNEDAPLVKLHKMWMKANPKYPADAHFDYTALREIMEFLLKKDFDKLAMEGMIKKMSEFIKAVNMNSFYNDKALKTIRNNIQSISFEIPKKKHKI